MPTSLPLCGSFVIGIGAEAKHDPWAWGAGYNGEYVELSENSGSASAPLTAQAWVWAIHRPVPLYAPLRHVIHHGAWTYATIDDVHPALSVASCQFGQPAGVNAAPLPVGWELVPSDALEVYTQVIGRYRWATGELVLQASTARCC